MSRRVVVVLVLFALANGFFLLNTFSRRRTLPPAQDFAKPDYSGGAHIQRDRIEKYVGRVAGADIDKLVKELNTYEPLLVFAESRSQDPVPELTFEVCLANRRLAAIYAILRERNRRDSADACVNIFNDKLSIMKADWARVFFEWEEQGGSKKVVPIIEDYHSASAALFLVASFSDSQSLIDCVDRWTESAEEIRRRVDSRGDLKPLENEARMRGGLESLFTLNLYILHLTERFQVGPIDSILDGLTRRPMTYTVIPFIAWDGHTNASDFTHNHAMVPIDSNKVIRTFDVCRSWHSASVHSDEDKRNVIAAVRLKLEKEIARNR